MTEQILAALAQLGIKTYLISETDKESLECFFVKKRLDLKRSTDTKEVEVTVYRAFEKDGKDMLGSSIVQIHPGQGKEEILDVLAGAYRAAALVSNPYYELPSGRKEEPVPANGRFAADGLAESMKNVCQELFAADHRTDVFLNSAEVFLRRHKTHILNSSGVDVRYETYDVWGEYVVQCVEPQDVETYHQFKYRDLEAGDLQKRVEEAFETTLARARASKAPKAGVYTVLLSGDQVKTLFDYYLSRASTNMVYQKYSNYEVGCQVQGGQVEGDLLTIRLKAKDPYSPEGIPMKDRTLLEEGVLKTLHGGARFAYYLGVEPTGKYRCISVPVGSTPLEEMKSKPYLHLVSFSDFQMDDFTGHFGGEIRLGFLYDGETVTPVTGGSVSGSILDVQDRLTFSKERYHSADYDGPFAVRIEGLRVAGEA